MTSVHRTISGPSTHLARVGNASFPAWRMPNGDEVVDLRTSTDVKGRYALNEAFLRLLARSPSAHRLAVRPSAPNSLAAPS